MFPSSPFGISKTFWSILMQLDREIMTQLKLWKNSRRRKPLILQGARQTGKSWVLKKFGELAFENTAYLNFDLTPSLKADFARTKEPAQILACLELTAGTRINPGSTLIILDEIQECNDALNALKYFCETAPEYAIVCAGSLLGVALNRSGASFPVGKVNFLQLHPLTFSEYLKAIEPDLHQSYIRLEHIRPVPEVLHEKLLSAWRVYLFLGGMPEAVSIWGDTRSVDEVLAVQSEILQAYTQDFSKHISNKDIPRVLQVWNCLQDQLAREDRKFRYADIQKSARSREYEAAIEWLVLAGLVSRVHNVQAPRFPLSAYKNSSAFKLYLNDPGLLCRKFALPADVLTDGSRLFTEFKGALAENAIASSLYAQFGSDLIFYWTSGNTAEVEFVLQTGSRIVPVEVKAEHNIHAKSLALYRQKYAPEISVRFSSRNLRLDGGILNVPLYLADRLCLLIEKACESKSQDES